MGWERGRASSDCTNGTRGMVGEAVSPSEEWETSVCQMPLNSPMFGAFQRVLSAGVTKGQIHLKEGELHAQ